MHVIMDSLDDDFGELYADIEVQVKSTLGSAPYFTKLYTQSEVDNDDKNNESDIVNKNDCNIRSEKDNSNPDLRLEENLDSTSNQKVSGLEADYESDSEDELNIVLNDDDCKRLPAAASGGGVDEDEDGVNRTVGDGTECNASNNSHAYDLRHSQYKYTRPQGSLFPSSLRINGRAGRISTSSVSGRGDWKDTGFNQDNCFNSHVTGIRAKTISVFPQSTYGFSRPWYRTILDIDINSFEEKPWTHPITDISDFFNYGFDDGSWKNYCDSLNKIRVNDPMGTRLPISESSKLYKGYEVEREKLREAVTDSDAQVGPSMNRGERPFALSRGKAIEVEGSIGERQPSVDIWRPRVRASDVVIEINVQDSAKDFSGIRKEEAGHIDNDTNNLDCSKNRDLDLDHDSDVDCCAHANADEPSADSLEEDVKSSEISSGLRRLGETVSASNQPLHVSGSHRHGEISAGDRYCHKKVNIHKLEGMSEAEDTLNEAEEAVGRDRHKSDPCSIETELSLGNQSQFRLRQSSASDSEASKDSIHGDPVRSCGLTRRQSPNLDTGLQESATSALKNHKINVSNRKMDRKYHSKQRNCDQEDQKHHRGRQHGVRKQNINSVNNHDTSPVLNGKENNIRYLKHGHRREKWKHCTRIRHSGYEQNICENDDNASPIHANGMYNGNYRSVNCTRRAKKYRDFGYRDREDLYYEEVELSSGGDHEISIDNRGETAHRKYPRGKFHWRFRNRTDLYIRKELDERECRHKTSARIDKEDDADYWCHPERRLFAEKLNPLPAHRECKQLVSKYSSSFKERNTDWRSESDEFHFRKRVNFDEDLLDCDWEDDFMQERLGRSYPFNDRKGYFLDSMTHSPLIQRDVKFSVMKGKHGDSHHLQFDRSWDVKHEFRRHPNRTSLSLWEDYTANEGRRHDPLFSRADAYDHRLTERYETHGRDMHDKEHEIGLHGFRNDIYDTKYSIMDDDNLLHMGRRKHWQSIEHHWIEGESIARKKETEFFAERASYPYEENARHERICAEYELDRDGMFVYDDMELECQRNRLAREESSANCINRNSDISFRDKHELSAVKCRDSVPLTVGKGKQSSGRWLNKRPEKMDLKRTKVRTASEEIHRSKRGKVVQTDNMIRASKPKDDLDIEEGQIVLEEPNVKKHLENKHSSESRAHFHNVKKRISLSEFVSGDNKVAGKYDNQYILETMAKMEKRRERFKDTVTQKKELDNSPKPNLPRNNPKPEVDLTVESTEIKQQRPTRKRRWGGF